MGGTSRGRRGVRVGLALGVVMLVSLSAYLIVSHNHDPGISLLFLDRQLHLVSGVRVELYAFYPTSTGTVFTQVFNEYTSSSSVTLPLQAVGAAASAWLNQYSDLAEPSLIGFAVHVFNQSGSILAEAESFTVGFDPKSVLGGQGFTQPVVFEQPIIINLSRALSTQAGVLKPQAAGAGGAALSTTTTTTTVPSFVCKPWYYCSVEYDLNWVVYYPSQNSFGKVPLIEADASAVYTDGLAQYIQGFVEAYMKTTTSTTLSLEVSEADDFSSVSYQIPGASITLKSSTLSENVYENFGMAVNNYPSSVEIYEEAQLALANYSVWAVGPGYATPLGSALQVFTTGVVIEQSSGSSLPVLYGSSGLTLPFNPNEASLLGTINPGGSSGWVSSSLTSNQLPSLTTSIPVGAIFAALVPAGADLAGILPDLNLVYQTSTVTLEFTEFYLVLSSQSPVPVSVYVDVPPVSYSYNAGTYTVPTTIFQVDA
jgi:hypothetical protein